MKAIKVEIKFDFRVGHKVFPAGVYVLESASQINENLLQLRGMEKENQQLIAANHSYSRIRQSPKLVFHQVGENYYLTDIFLADGNWGFSVRQPRKKVSDNKNPAQLKVVIVSARN